MDFDDDSLDDLLRDTSANKFKKPVVNAVADELFSNPNPQTSRKEKKSALLAELFGPSSTNSGALESSLENHEKAIEKSTLINSLSVNPPEFSFGSYVPSSVAKLTVLKSSDSFGQQKPTDVFQPSNFGYEQRSLTSDQLETAGSLKQSLNYPLSVKEPVTSKLQFPIPVQVPETISDAEFNTKPHNDLPSSTTASPSFPKPISKGTNGTQQIRNESSPVTNNVIPFTFPLPKNQPVSKDILGETNLTIFKEVLDNFSNGLCKRLETLIEKNENFSDITNCLVDLHKCINTASQNWISSVNKIPDRTQEELEKRMLLLENKIELTSQENTSLRARLEFVESQLRENHNESSRIKTDTETVIKSHLKWMKEAVDNLDNKVSAYSSQNKHQAVEDSSSRESLLQQMQEKLSDFESKLAKNTVASGQKQEETLHLLKAECKWLERQKKKLKTDRKELRIFQQKIQDKQRILEELSAGLSKTSHHLQSQCLAVDTRIKKIYKLWTSIQEKQGQLGEENKKEVSKHSSKSSDIQMEDFGLALWKLHVKGDEQKLCEQHNFLQMLNKIVI